MKHTESIEDAARITFLRQRHIPQVSHCPTLTFLRTNLLCQLFPIDEGEHSFHILPFCLGQCLQHVEMVLNDTKALSCYLYLLCHNLVTQTNRLVKQFLIVVNHQ